MKIFIVLVLADTIFEHRGMLELLKTINSIPSDTIYELGITLFSGRNHLANGRFRPGMVHQLLDLNASYDGLDRQLDLTLALQVVQHVELA